MKVAIIIVTLIAAHWMVGSVFCQALSPDQWLQAAGSDHSVLATQHSNTGWNRTVVGKSTEWPSTVARCNHTNGSSVQPSNWFRFTYRFAIQCAFVFFILLLVLLMCFYPGKDLSSFHSNTNSIPPLIYTRTLSLCCSYSIKVTLSRYLCVNLTWLHSWHFLSSSPWFCNLPFEYLINHILV